MRPSSSYPTGSCRASRRHSIGTTRCTASPAAPTSAPSARRRGPRVRAMAVRAAVGVATELVEALPALEIIAIYGVGTDKVDLAHAQARGVRVTNTPDVLTEDVADMALGLILATLRRLCVGDRFVRDGRWARREAWPLATKSQRQAAGHRRPGTHRPRHRPAGRRLRRGHRLHRPARPRRRALPLRAVAGRRWRATATSWWWPSPAAPSTRGLVDARGPGCPRAGGRADQCRPRQRGGRGGAGRRPAHGAARRRWARRVRERARRARSAARAGPGRAAAAPGECHTARPARPWASSCSTTWRRTSPADRCRHRSPDTPLGRSVSARRGEPPQPSWYHRRDTGRLVGMAYARVTVFGGSGFLGRQIVWRLADDGAEVRVAVRRPERAAFLAERRPADRSCRSAPMSGSRRRWGRRSKVRRPWSTPSATMSSGALPPSQRSTARVPSAVARLSALAGVQRLVHISGLGADPASDSPMSAPGASANAWFGTSFPKPPSSARASSSDRGTRS